MQLNIATASVECAQLFNDLISFFKKNSQPINLPALDEVVLEDQFDRFRIWGGNLGAFLSFPAKTSLDYRLRHSQKVASQLLDLLHDLKDALQIVLDIATGARPNREAEPNDEHEDSDEDSDTNEDSENIHAVSVSNVASQFESANAHGQNVLLTEAEELFETAKTTIASLFRIAVLIRKTTTRDRFARALASQKETLDATFDIRHVCDKFPRLVDENKLWLCARSGRAITQRRQFLSYRRSRRDKHGGNEAQPWQDEGCPSVLETQTSATTFSYTGSSLEVNDDDETNSQASSTLSLADDQDSFHLQPPRLLDVSKGETMFECPLYWTMQACKQESTWQKHVYCDLHPYVCTFPECDVKLFSDPHTWFEHEMQHRAQWCCQLCHDKTFQSEDSFQDHLRTHAGSVARDQIQALRIAARRPVERFRAHDCPFCSDWGERLREYSGNDQPVYVTVTQFKKHVGSHMRQLALFAIPREHVSNGDEMSRGESASRGQVAMSISSFSSSTKATQKLPTDDASVDQSNAAVEDFSKTANQEHAPNLDRLGDSIATDSNASLESTNESILEQPLASVQYSGGIPPKEANSRSPPYIFRIDEIREHPRASYSTDNNGHWLPSTTAGHNMRVQGGVSGMWWYCNGQQITQLENLPPGVTYYKCFSAFFCASYGFWILSGDASSPPAGEAWGPLRFDLDATNRSSYVANAGEGSSLIWKRSDQKWPSMLFPDIYHAASMTTDQGYGGLTGDLPILLALIALSVEPEHLRQILPLMFTNAAWTVHGLKHCRVDRRGVVAYVYTCPENWHGRSTSDSREDLAKYEEGEYGPYYN